MGPGGVKSRSLAPICSTPLLGLGQNPGVLKALFFTTRELASHPPLAWKSPDLPCPSLGWGEVAHATSLPSR